MDKLTAHKVFNIIAFLYGVSIAMEMCVVISVRAPTTVGYNKNSFYKLNEQNNAKPHEFKDDYHTLINLKPFVFLINPRICHQQRLLLLILVPTSPPNFALRAAIRSTWTQQFDSVKLVFLLGESNTSITKKLKEEDKVYGDIVQGNFKDAYKNLTYKHAMGLKWVAHHCGTARYILKMDDDVFVHVKKLRSFLTRKLPLWGARDLIACRPSYNREVKRSGKWAVSKSEIPDRSYPDYCMGYFIVYSQDTIHRLLERVQKLPYFWIDDVQITGFAARDINVNITPVNNIAITYKQSDQLIEDIRNSSSKQKHFLFGPDLISDKKMRKMWKVVIQNDGTFAKWKELIGRHKPLCFLPKTLKLRYSIYEMFPEDCNVDAFRQGYRKFLKDIYNIHNATDFTNAHMRGTDASCRLCEDGRDVTEVGNSHVEVKL